MSPTVPDESILTATVGIMRKRFSWLYLPILNLDGGSNLIPSNRLKYLLGSSLRGSSTTFQERSKDGAVKFVEDKPWEELEKMDMSGPGFISIDALKCQTLSQVESMAQSKPVMNRQTKKRRFGGEEEDVFRDEIQRSGERGDDVFPTDGFEEDEERFLRGERENFEHELLTDGLSTIPLHFLRSLFPPRSRMTGQGWKIGVEMQKLIQLHSTEISQDPRSNANQASATEQDSSSRSKKRKALPLSTLTLPPNNPTSTTEPISSTSGPTLRSARSTRKKSSAGVAPNPPVGSNNKRTKKR